MKSVNFNYSYSSRLFFEICGETYIDCTKEVLWNALTQPQNVIYFNSFVKSNEHLGIEGVKHKDQCEYYNGKVLTREVVEYVKNKRVKFLIYQKKNHNNNYTVFDIMESDSKLGTKFRLSIQSDAYRNVPRPIWYFVARLILIPHYRKYIEAVVKGMNYYCTTGQQVIRNQFGHHNQFSPKQ